MKKLLFFFAFTAFTGFFLPLNGFSDTVFLKEGTRWDVGKTWEEDGQIKFELYGSIVGFPKQDVLKVEKTDSFQSSSEKEKIEKPAFAEELNESCYVLGYKYGLCATKSLHGISCKTENDIVIPKRCRGKTETKRGIKAGAKEVYDILNLDTGSSR